MNKFWDKLIYVIMSMVAIVTFFITGFVGFLLGSKTIDTVDQDLNKQILNLSSENIKKLNTGEKIFCADGKRRNVVEIDTFGKGGLDLRRFDYGVAIGLSVEYRHYMIGVEGRLGLCKLQKELQGKNITGFVTAGYKF